MMMPSTVMMTVMIYDNETVVGWIIKCLMCVNRLLNEAEGSLLDDEHLLITLQTSKSTSQDIKEQLETAEETEQQIDAAREVIRLVFYGHHACVL